MTLFLFDYVFKVIKIQTKTNIFKNAHAILYSKARVQ